MAARESTTARAAVGSRTTLIRTDRGAALRHPTHVRTGPAYVSESAGAVA